MMILSAITRFTPMIDADAIDALRLRASLRRGCFRRLRFLTLMLPCHGCFHPDAIFALLLLSFLSAYFFDIFLLYMPFHVLITLSLSLIR